MKFRTFTYAAAIYVSLFSALPCPTWAEPIFTSIKEADCHDPSSSITAAYDAKGLTVQECAAVKGWRLFVASSDERSWIDIGRGSSLWSTEREVVYSNDFGFFPNIGGSVAEWGMKADGPAYVRRQPTAGNYGGLNVPSYLIFRIAAQDDNLRRVSRLFVIDLKGKEPAFCGIAKTNEEARALAATKGGCKRRLLPRLR